MLDISVITLAHNEHIHMRRCLDRITPYVKAVYVIDCYSDDDTVQIATEYSNVTVLQHEWVNYASQFKWALDNAPISTQWVLRLDADEYLSDELIDELERRLPALDKRYSGVLFPLRRVFLGREIKHGIARGIKMLRLFRYGQAHIEDRQMDEHMELVSGEMIEFEHSFSDDNLNNLSWWTQKHVGYAIREAVDLLDAEYNLTEMPVDMECSSLSAQVLAKRKKKEKYARMPLFWRSFVYFLYRYFVKLGFLDGKEGFLWDFLQGWWYRTLVDAKIYEIKKATGGNKEKICQHLKEVYGIDLKR